MKNNLLLEPWRIIENEFRPEENRVVESLFSLGNGRQGHRAHFEEDYQGDSLHGCYLAGLYYPDRGETGLLRYGLPLEHARMLNAVNWLGLKLTLDGEKLDLHTCRLEHFRRVLDIKRGILERRFLAELPSGHQVEVQACRFCSMDQHQLGAIRYTLTPLNFSGTLNLIPYLDLNVRNAYAQEEGPFWVETATQIRRTHAYLMAETKRTHLQVCSGMKVVVEQDGEALEYYSHRRQLEKFVGFSIDLKCEKNKPITIYKYVANSSYLDEAPARMMDSAKKIVKQAARDGFDRLLERHEKAWSDIWERTHLEIDGDPEAQLGLRFGLFHLYQAYSGQDERLNISPRAFTGEAHDGNTYWDSEAFCLPFFMATAGAEWGKRLLLFRYRQLDRAKENARRLGYARGAALYPMATIDGRESHQHWERALLEVHRNGAVARAIYDYYAWSGDDAFLWEAGLEMLVALSRFWADRVDYLPGSGQYAILGVTGPNTYEINVDNNYYTNYAARWTLAYTLDAIERLAADHPETWDSLSEKLSIRREPEMAQWRHIVEKMYLPEDLSKGIFLQHDGFQRKPIQRVADLPEGKLPIYRHWSWDRILRSSLIRQPDVLQTFFAFPEAFDRHALANNFDYYAPLTLEEQALTPGIHALLAGTLGQSETARSKLLDAALWDLHNPYGLSRKGCHVTSMGLAWQALWRGIAGMRVEGGQLEFCPRLPRHWKRLSFRLIFRNTWMEIRIEREGLQVKHLGGSPQVLKLGGTEHRLATETTIEWAAPFKK